MAFVITFRSTIPYYCTLPKKSPASASPRRRGQRAAHNLQVNKTNSVRTATVLAAQGGVGTDADATAV